MGEHSGIQWTDHTFNPWIGCHKVSQGCKHCYAENNTFTRRERSHGRELWGPKADRHITSAANWAKPLKWDRDAEAAGRRARVFCASLADVFEDHPALQDPRDALFSLIEMTPNLDWQLLTKRPENVHRMVPEAWRDAPAYPGNVWIGTSAEDQATWDERTEYLTALKARVVFVSCEPLLGPIRCGEGLDLIEWVIIGGESGRGARPCDVVWIRDIVAECREHRSSAFVKQLGARPYYGRPFLNLELRHPKGGAMEEWPEDLRVREFPAGALR